MMLLVPRDLLRPRRVDDHFTDEAAAARDLGVEVALVDHDDVCREGGSRVAVSSVPSSDDAVYRGWMLPAARYRQLELALADRGTTLRTSADAFRRAHELPGWYDALAPWTPRSTWTDGDERTAFEQAAAALGPGPAVLRDHTKSGKHHWEEAAFVPDLADLDTAWGVARRLRELRDDLHGRFRAATVRAVHGCGGAYVVGRRPLRPGRRPPRPRRPAPRRGVRVARRPRRRGPRARPAFVTIELVRHDDGRRQGPRTLPAADLVTALVR